MKKAIVIILTVLFVVVLAGGAYILLFDKTIPTNWASGQIEEVKQSKFSEDDKMPSVKVFYEQISYSQEDGKTVVVYNQKFYRELKNQSTDDAEGYEIVSKDYDGHGNLSEEAVVKYYIEDGKYYRSREEVKQEISDFSEVGLFFMFVADFYKNDMTFKDEIVDAIDNNLDHVSQKGLNITLHLVKDDAKLDITYNVIAKKVVKLELTIDTYTENVLTNRIHQYVEY